MSKKDEEENSEEEVEGSQDPDENSEENSEDEDVKDDDSDEEDESDEDDSDEDEDESEEEDDSDDDSGTFKKRFTQFEGETPEEYLKNLEKAYAESSTEGQRLKKQYEQSDEAFKSLKDKAAKDPEFAKKLNAVIDGEDDTPPDPTAVWADQQRAKEADKEFAEFAAVYPEIKENAEMSEKVLDELEKYAAYEFKVNKKLVGMKEGLEKAWVLAGYEPRTKTQTKDNKESQMAANKPGTQSKNNSKKKPQTKGDEPQISDKQVATARSMDPALKGKSDAEVKKELAKYLTTSSLDEK